MNTQEDLDQFIRERALQIAIDLYKSKDTVNVYGVAQLIADASVIEKFLKDGK